MKNSAVSILPDSAPCNLREALWLHAAATGDVFDFLADPAEDIYTMKDGEPFDIAV